LKTLIIFFNVRGWTGLICKNLSQHVSLEFHN